MIRRSFFIFSILFSLSFLLYAQDKDCKKMDKIFPELDASLSWNTIYLMPEMKKGKDLLPEQLQDLKALGLPVPEQIGEFYVLDSLYQLKLRASAAEKCPELFKTWVPEPEQFAYSLVNDEEVNVLSEWKKEGKWIAFHKTGNLRFEGMYVNDIRNGTFTSWFENGEKKEERRYISGKLHGKYYAYYKDGTMRVKAEYRLGEILPETYSEYYPDGRKMIEVIRDDKTGLYHEVIIRKNGTKIISRGFTKYFPPLLEPFIWN